MARFGKSYSDKSEMNLRLGQWLKADEDIRVFKQRGKNSFQIGHNKYSDWTEAEYDKLLGYSPMIEK